MNKDNVKYTKEDLVDHEAVSAIIQNKNNDILILKHEKFGFWTVPMGKVDKSDSSLEMALKREVREEVGVFIKNYVDLGSFLKQYERQGKIVNVVNHVYSVVSYNGTPTNVEKEKHSELRWIPIKDITSLGDNISDAMRYIKRYFRIA